MQGLGLLIEMLIALVVSVRLRFLVQIFYQVVKMKIYDVNDSVKIISLLIIMLFSSAMRAEPVCGVLSENIGNPLHEAPISAEYKYTIIDSERNIQQEKTLTLWRRDRQVVVQIEKNHPLELWELTKNNQLRVTRFFEEERRGIEYQPDEVKKGPEKNDWSFKYQLISNSLIDRMSTVDSVPENKKTYEDCSDVQYLYLNTKKSKIELVWAPEIKLMVSLLVKEPHISTQWELQKVLSDEETINQYFSRLMSYQTTDYADIGDNESDPFLIKMINMGFVEHGASGFYDSAGHSLGDEKSHSH